MLKNILKILAIFIIGMVGGIFADQIFWPYFVERPLFYQYRLEQSPVYVTERKEITIQENVALENAIEKTKKAVVGIKTKTKAGKTLEGSGLILTSDGLIVTLADLVPKGSTFSLFIDEEVYFENLGEDKILQRDFEENLVLIKIDKTNLPTVGFANLEKLKLGERVFLVGKIAENDKNALLQEIANEGIVTSFNQEAFTETATQTVSFSDSAIETNIFERSFLAGSPLFNIEGNVLGLNLLDKDGRVMAIPISKIRVFVNL